MPYLFWALGLPEVAQMSPQGWGHEGSLWTICVHLLPGLVLLQGRNQDPNFQREEARPDGRRGIRGRPGTVPQTLSTSRAETIFTDMKLKPAQPPTSLL